MTEEHSSKINQVLTDHWDKIEECTEIVFDQDGQKKKVVSHENMNILMGDLFREIGKELNYRS